MLPSLVPIQGRSTDALFEYDFITESTCDVTLLQLIGEHFRRLVNSRPTFEVLSMVPQNAYEFLKSKQPLQALFAKEFPSNVVPLCKVNSFYDIYLEEEFVEVDELRDVSIYELIHFEQELPNGKMVRCVRIRGQAFADKKLLKQFNRAIEQALQSDPVKLAGELGLVLLLDDDVLWCPKGMEFRESITSFWKEECHARGDRIISALDPLHAVRKQFQAGRFASISQTSSDEIAEGLFQPLSNTSFEHFIFTSEAALANELISSLQFIAKMASILKLEANVVLLQKGKQVPNDLILALSSLGIAFEQRPGDRAEIIFNVRDLRGRAWPISQVTIYRREGVLIHIAPILSLERVLALLLERGEEVLGVGESQEP